MRMRFGLVVLALGACAGPAGTGDASPPDGPSFAIAPPARVDPPDLTPCPPGWREVALRDATVCEPWGDDRAPSCAAEELAVLGRPAGEACEPAMPCGTEEWPDDPTPTAIYARPGALDGDGTAARPFGTITAAASAARAAGSAVTEIVLGEGEFVEAVRVGGPLTIRGLCPERTRVRDPATSSSAAIAVASGTVHLSGVGVRGEVYGLWMNGGATLVAEGVTAWGRESAVRVDGGATFDATRLRADRPVVVDNAYPTILVGPTATVALRASTLSGGGGAIYGYGRPTDPTDPFSVITIEDSAILDTPCVYTGRSDVTLRRVAVERVGFAVAVIAPRSATFEDVRIRDAGQVVFGTPEDGAVVSSGGGHVTLRRVAISDVEAGSGLLAFGTLSPDARIDGEDVVVTDVADTTAILVSEGASIELSRLYVAEVAGSAIQSERRSSLVLRDVRVEGTHLVGTYGDAIASFAGGTLVVDGARLAPARTAILVADGTIATVNDLDVEGGQGIVVQCEVGSGCDAGPVMLTLHRARLHGGVRYGLAALIAPVTLSDVDIDGVEWLETTEFPGMGILSGFGATIRGENVRVRDVEGVGMIALRGATIDARHVTVDGTRRVTCDTCGELATFGDGVVCAEEGVLVLDDLTARGSERAGFAAAERCAPPTLGPGLVEHNRIGILADVSIDPAPFRMFVLRDNDEAFGSATLSITPHDLGLD